MLDYAEPGALGMFTDRSTVDKLARKMAREGVLEGASMAGTFDILRANDLIFNYVVSNWLMGQDPPAFDILAWNADSTRMPAAMHAFYLRNFYVDNKLAAGELEIAGKTIDLSAIKAPTYVVSAINDHIVPWQSSYKTTGLVSGPGALRAQQRRAHRRHRQPAGPEGLVPGRADRGRRAAVQRPCLARGAERRAGSWWEDWARWSDEHAGPMQDPPRMGSQRYPVLGDGPGTYVHT
jgi:polyhydroxyalkanoate synthase